MSQDDFSPNVTATSTPAQVEEDEPLSDSVSEEKELPDGVITSSAQLEENHYQSTT